MNDRISQLAIPAVLLLPLAAGAQPCLWESVPVPSPAGSIESQLLGIDGAAGDDVWAVGNATVLVGSSRVRQTMIVHFDGSAWSIVDSPNPGKSTSWHLLWDVAAMAPDEVMAVGSYVPPTIGTASQPLALLFDGSAWSHLAAPSFPGGGQFAALTTIDGEFWAGGQRVSPDPPPSAFTQALVARWDGGSWSHEVTPPLALHGQDSYNEIWGIDGVSSSDVWGVGTAFQQPRFTGDPEAFGPLPYITHYDGSQWRLVEAPVPEPRATYLESVAAISSDDVWAVGRYNDFATSSTQPYIIHWNGSSWAMSDVPHFPENGAILSSVTARGPDDVFAAGAVIDSSGFASPLVLHFDGTDWTVMDTPAGGEFRGIAALPTGDVWAAGLPSFTARLVCDGPSCYADCDGSGSLDFFDFLCFQNRFAAGDPQADCDDSGSLDFFDFLCFQDAFAAGCP